MSVLAHESGSYPVLYRSFGLPAGSDYFTGYLARPDKQGQFPVVVALHGLSGISSAIKDVCWHLARRGYAAAAIDWHRGRTPASIEEAVAVYEEVTDRRVAGDISDAIDFTQAEDVEWSSKGPIGLIGIGVGGRFALSYAADAPAEIGSVVACYAPLRGDDSRDSSVASALERLAVPTLGLYGAADELVPVSDVDYAQTINTTGQWIVYEGVGHGFLDATEPGYDGGASHDALERAAALFLATLPAPQLAVTG